MYVYALKELIVGHMVGWRSDLCDFTARNPFLKFSLFVRDGVVSNQICLKLAYCARIKAFVYIYAI